MASVSLSEARGANAVCEAEPCCLPAARSARYVVTDPEENGCAVAAAIEPQSARNLVRKSRTRETVGATCIKEFFSMRFTFSVKNLSYGLAIVSLVSAGAP